MGRQRKFTARRLGDEVERYFNSISRTVTATEKYDSGEKDSDGHVVWSYRPIVNDNGEEIRYREYVIPPTVAGLCEYLHIHRSTWADYCDAVLYPEYHDTTTRTRGRIRVYLEEQLLSRKDVRGIIFDLQNNHGYSERQTVELGPGARKSIANATSAREKENLLQDIIGEMTETENQTGNETGDGNE
jgi:hypothetical protein